MTQRNGLLFIAFVFDLCALAAGPTRGPRATLCGWNLKGDARNHHQGSGVQMVSKQLWLKLWWGQRIFKLNTGHKRDSDSSGRCFKCLADTDYVRG